MLDQRTRHARALFGGIAARYDRPAAVLSFGRYGAWRRSLVRALDLSPDARVLDVATGTGLIARDIRRRYRARVTGLDQSEPMLRRASGDRVCAAADALPFPDGSFDAVVFSYLLRYVPDPARTLGELSRAVRPGGTLASVEFGVPRASLARAGWTLYARGAFPMLARAFGPGWRAVGEFLPASITEWAERWPVERQLALWRQTGVRDVRARALTLGTGIVILGTKT